MEQSTKGQSEAEHLFEIVRARYGHHLDDQQIEAVRENVEDTVDLVSQLRGVKLDNSVEPYSLFRPHRGEDADG
ncbi:MAG: hypothetical protein QF672_17190 [SAR202 cluster bacterium]|nr:hypothetical protein [SAR202 cluster bacterium]